MLYVYYEPFEELNNMKTETRWHKQISEDTCLANGFDNMANFDSISLSSWIRLVT